MLAGVSSAVCFLSFPSPPQLENDDALSSHSVLFFRLFSHVESNHSYLPCLCFAPENTEAQRGGASCFWSHSQLEAKPGIELPSPGSQHAAP